MKYYHACIFAQYTELEGVVDVWKTKSNSLYVVEHPADGKTKRIHCHFLIETESGENWFRESAKEIMGEFIKRGNYWIATRVQKGEHSGKPIDRTQTLTYMLKGKFVGKFAKNFSKEEVDNSRQSWVDSVKNDKTESSPTEYWINDIYTSFVKKYPSYNVYMADFDIKYEDMITPPSPNGMLLDEVRHTTYRRLYERHGIAPHAHLYKQVASSVFLRLMEKWDKLDTGIHLILNLWK